MTSEMETNETMQKTENTMQDARECAPPAPAALMRENARASEHAARKRLSNPCSKSACASVRRWQPSIFDTAGHDLQLLMMCTRAAFYATEPSNAAAYAPVEACGAHEWSYIAHGWRARSAACSPESDASAHGQEGGAGGILTEGGLPRHASAHGHQKWGSPEMGLRLPIHW